MSGALKLELAVLAKAGKEPLTKRIALDKDGHVVSDGSACTMSAGYAVRFAFPDVARLGEEIDRFGPDQALTLGALRPDLPQQVAITTKRRLNGSPGLMIARTKDYFVYRIDEPALALLDHDLKGMPPEVAERIKSLGGLEAALAFVIPEIGRTERLVRASTSAGLFRSDTGQVLPGSGGQHVFLLLQDGTDVERFLETLHARCWLAGLGWLMVGAGGQLLERSIVDRVVGSPERLVFEGAPVLIPPLAQDKAKRRPVAIAGDMLDSVAACPPLSIVEQSRLRERIAKEAARLKPECDGARQEFVAEHAARLAARIGMPKEEAVRVLERKTHGVLLPEVVLPFDDEDLAGATVADVLADPARFEGETLADPLEGPQYGTGKAKVLRRSDGTPWIHSFAHGRTVYELRLDFAAAKAKIENAAPDKGAEAFVYVALSADLNRVQREQLRDLAASRAKCNKRTLDAMLNAARADRAAEARTQQVATRQDPRPQLPAPLPDAEWLPVMGALNEVLGAVDEPEPPMRDLEGCVVKVRVRRVPKTHALTSLGANAEESEESRLPAPELPLITLLDVCALGEMIERYIQFVSEGDRAVHLGRPFVDHYQRRDDDALPIAAAVTTLPIVLGDGTILKGRGLDRERGIVFRVPPELAALLPEREACTTAAVVAAMRFLCDEWLCDVATDYAGKCVLIAFALTIIERSLLPDRPVFWVTAGRRGGGKTTALIMIVRAVTGLSPPAAAWSPSEEERRKALLAYLMEGLACIIWDNIPRNARIACPHIEKACTIELYSDRKLGVSETVATSASTIMGFTGNNVGPRGDLSSRSLEARIRVERPDPENRSFRHPDPIGWTDANRGKILQSLYTVLLGNPLFHGEGSAVVTRFKTWWALVGQAVEYAAREHAREDADFPPLLVEEGDYPCPPTVVDFKAMFITLEEDDEDTASLRDVLTVLAAQYSREKSAPDQTVGIRAADIMRTIEEGSKEGAMDATKERADVLRSFFTSSKGTLNTLRIGRRLAGAVEDPVLDGDRILILKKDEDRHAKQYMFRVVVRKAGD